MTKVSTQFPLNPYIEQDIYAVLCSELCEPSDGFIKFREWYSDNTNFKSSLTFNEAHHLVMYAELYVPTLQTSRDSMISRLRSKCILYPPDAAHLQKWTHDIKRLHENTSAAREFVKHTMLVEEVVGGSDSDGMNCEVATGSLLKPISSRWGKLKEYVRFGTFHKPSKMSGTVSTKIIPVASTVNISQHAAESRGISLSDGNGRATQSNIMCDRGTPCTSRSPSPHSRHSPNTILQSRSHEVSARDNRMNKAILRRSVSMDRLHKRKTIQPVCLSVANTPIHTPSGTSSGVNTPNWGSRWDIGYSSSMDSDADISRLSVDRIAEEVNSKAHAHPDEVVEMLIASSPEQSPTRLTPPKMRPRTRQRPPTAGEMEQALSVLEDI
eukprot:CAMPEP_0185034448 /NCGR_PEP_ID=MMETSP1103-20130426/24360_1 /TAXON_ID=36769 /ORGANISM="Paraphysomonas bandaiensis, Strain Caron Lab Isolate" /LENGTH=381 /DNA_ID=CAMNT_0027571111 /DNA_START=223 /DNA_END=1368 /DNA_ORIENTATION=+